MVETNNQAYFELCPFVIEAISYNEDIYKDIDDLYKKYKYHFYKCAKSSKYYNHLFIREKNLIQEEYAKKALGIISIFLYAKNGDIQLTQQQLDEIERELINIFRKGWKYTFAYVDNHNQIDVEHFFKCFIKKHNGIKNIPTTVLNSNIAVLYFLALYKGKKMVKNEALFNIENMFCNRFKYAKIYDDKYGHQKGNFMDNYVSDGYKKKIDILKKEFYSLFGKVKSIDDIIDAAKNYIDPDLIDIMLCPLFNLSILDILDKIELNERDLETLLLIYAGYLDNVEKDIPLKIYPEKFMPFFVNVLCNTMLLKLYQETKDYYFKNNKETMYIELEELEKKVQDKNTEIKNLQIKIDNLNKTVEKQEKEILKLKGLLHEAQANANELNGLREFIFKLNNLEDYKEDNTVDLERIKELKCAVIGGHPKWQEKLKEKLPNFIYLTIDNINFDTNILNDVDVVFVNVNYNSHALYYKVMNIIRKTDKKVCYLTQNTNIDINVETIYKYLIKE